MAVIGRYWYKTIKAMNSNKQEIVACRQDSARWITWSQEVVQRLMRYMEIESINRQELAARLEVTPQYVSKLLSGKVNFSFKSISEIEYKLNIQLLAINSKNECPPA